MQHTSLLRRKIINISVNIISSGASLIGIFFLAWILFAVAKKGMGAFNIDFFTKLPTPPGYEGGGIANAILGTAIITLVSTLIGVPIGLMAGIYLAEFGRYSRFGNLVRFCTNVAMGLPSIIIGLFIYTLIVMPMKTFSGLAGAVALAIIMLPVIARTTEDMLCLVPNSLREASLALGALRWKTTLSVVFRAAKKGIITGILLSIARVSGETAPLLFTALNSVYWPKSLLEPTANLTVTIFNYAMSPYEDFQKIAWGASLMIMIGILAVNIIIRSVFKESKR